MCRAVSPYQHLQVHPLLPMGYTSASQSRHAVICVPLPYGWTTRFLPAFILMNDAALNNSLMLLKVELLGPQNTRTFKIVLQTMALPERTVQNYKCHQRPRRLSFPRCPAPSEGSHTSSLGDLQVRNGHSVLFDFEIFE